MSLDTSRPFIPLQIAVLSVSDTRSLEEDKSGDYLEAAIQSLGHTLFGRNLVKDDIAAIQDQVKIWQELEVDVIITTGGTGFTGRDQTPEAIQPLLDKTMDGFSHLFHQISYAKIGSSTIQSRAFAGLIGSTFIFCLPGSTSACRDAWEEILSKQLDYRFKPCNFIEIIPRLDEHLKRSKAK